MSAKIKGLVLGGGGSRGSYEAGVVQAFSDLGISFDVVTGTSIGALCGALYTQQDISMLKEWIASFHQNAVAQNLFMFPHQYQTKDLKGQSINAFLEMFTKDGPSVDLLRTQFLKVFDYQKFSRSPIRFGIMTYNVTQHKAQSFVKSDMTEENVMDILLASAAYFPAFNLVRIQDDYYLDGGYADTVPVSLAQQLGAKDITAVDLSDPGINTTVPKDTDLMLIRPILKLDYYLNFDGEQLLRQVSQGYLETLKYLNKAPGYLYTFYPDDWHHMQFLEKTVMDFLVSIGKVYLIEKLPDVLGQIYTFLLGYQPEPLQNQYAGPYIFGRLLEVMGLISGIDLYQQIHFKDFIKEMLEKLDHLNADPNLEPVPGMFHAMEMKGLKDLMVFFHSALLSYGSSLPESFKIFEKGDYILPYYLAWGWHMIEKFQLAFLL